MQMVAFRASGTGGGGSSNPAPTVSAISPNTGHSKWRHGGDRHGYRFPVGSGGVDDRRHDGDGRNRGEQARRLRRQLRRTPQERPTQ